jgi:hypothetical protein
VVAAIQEEKVLSPKDRCDRCIAQAKFLVFLSSGELYFCGHHFYEHETALVDIASDIFDETDVIPADPLDMEEPDTEVS